LAKDVTGTKLEAEFDKVLLDNSRPMFVAQFKLLLLTVQTEL